MKRIWPGIALFFIAPLVAEFLLGDLPIDMLGSLLILAPLYGGGALLIREVVRRTGGAGPKSWSWAALTHCSKRLSPPRPCSILTIFT